MARLTFLEKVEAGIYPSKEEFYDLYITQNKSYDELCEYYSVSRKIIKDLVKLYNIKKDQKMIQDNIKKTMQEKYGCDAPMQNKEILEKSKKTSLEKYGVEYNVLTEKAKNNHKENVDWEESISKRKETCLKKYGVEFPTQDSEVKNKTKQTNLQRYGVVTTLCVPEVKEKIRKTCLEKYGNEYFTATEAFKLKFGWTEETYFYMSSKENLISFFKQFNPKIRLHEAAEILKCSYALICDRVDQWQLEEYVDFQPRVSSYEIELQHLFDDWKIPFVKNDRSVLSKGEIDLYFPDYKVGIEFNGNYWHGESMKKKDYHQQKSLDAESKGIFLYHIFEYEWNNPRIKESIISQLKNIFHINENKIYARKTVLKEIKDPVIKRDFLQENHKQGTDYNSQIALGLYYNDELVSLMTFCKARFSNECEWELSRFCSKKGYNVIGGASKLFNYFVNRYKGSVVSYSDIAKTRGTLYEKLGFSLKGISKPSYIWFKSDIDYKTRFQTRMKNERETMQAQGYHRIYDAGVKTWFYIPQNINNKKQ